MRYYLLNLIFVKIYYLLYLLMVSLYFFLVIIYYSSLFALFGAFYVFKIIFQISSNSPKIIYQNMVRQYLPKYVIYAIILQFIGIVPSVVFYIKYCFFTNAPYIKYFYGILFLFLNLLVSIFFYLQFFKKWNVMTAEEYRYAASFRRIKHSEDLEIYSHFGSDWTKRYYFVYFLLFYILLNFIAPFYFQDLFQILYAVIL